MRVLDSVSRRLPALGALLSRAIDPLLNGAIILVSVLIVVALRSSTLPPPRHNSDTQIERPISLQGVDWSKREKTLLMFLSTQCRFCRKSEPFYRRLSLEVTDRQKVRLIALFPQPADTAKQYLASAKITVDETRQSGDTDFRAQGTPTLILVNRNGIATNKWLGLLSPDEEADLLNRLGVGQVGPRDRPQN
jgi:thioredoxin-related protein